MPSRLRRRGPGGLTVPRFHGWESPEESGPVARTPQRAVETGRREVAVSTPVRRWPGTTRCNELAVIVMRDGEPVGREPLIAPFC